VICYPDGGFNDILFNINRCFYYSITFNRLLIIDTTKIGWFNHDIRDYIQFEHPNIYTGNLTTIYSELEQSKNLTVFPPADYEILSQYKPGYNRE
jgi:hypothetical protein